MNEDIEPKTEKELPLSELDDKTQLDFLLKSILERSDFTIHGTDTCRLRKILKHTESTNGYVTEEDLKKVFRTKVQLAAYIRKYGLTPWKLQDFVADFVTGNVKLTGGTENNTYKNIDLLGVFTELTVRFKFKKGMVYEALAEQLYDDWDKEPADNLAYSKKTEFVRQAIAKLKKQLKK